MLGTRPGTHPGRTPSFAHPALLSPSTIPFPPQPCSAMVRQVDCVTVKGSNKPVGLFTYDVDVEGLQGLRIPGPRAAVRGAGSGRRRLGQGWGWDRWQACAPDCGATACAHAHVILSLHLPLRMPPCFPLAQPLRSCPAAARRAGRRRRRRRRRRPRSRRAATRASPRASTAMSMRVSPAPTSFW